MHADTSQRSQPPRVANPEVAELTEKNVVGGMEFKGIGSVKIVASAGLDTRKALSMAEQVIEIMRDELRKKEQSELPGKLEDESMLVG